MTKIRMKSHSIPAFALAIMLLFAGCRQTVVEPQMSEPPEPYEPATVLTQTEPNMPASENNASEIVALEPEKVQEAVDPREPAWGWEPWDTQDMEWPELFAAIVELNRDFWSWWDIEPTWFALMDFNGDGQPEFLFGSEAKNITGVFIVLSADFAEQFLQLGTNAFMHHPYELRVWGERPLRFFVDENSGEQIFSSVAATGPIFTRFILYTDVQTLRPRWEISCSVNANGEHIHELRVLCEDEWRWTTLETLESPLLDLTQWLAGDLVWPCDIWYGRGSADYTVVTLVNIVLSGFTEMPTPTLHKFPGEFDWENPFGAEHVKSVQDWIFEVAALLE